MAQTKTMDTLVIQKFVENNMDAYIIAGTLLGFGFVALATLETIINFIIWLFENKRK